MKPYNARPHITKGKSIDANPLLLTYYKRKRLSAMGQKSLAYQNRFTPTIHAQRPKH